MPGETLGGRCPPNTPWQEPEVPARCSIVALRPIGRIARFAPHLQVAVSATGRAPFRCLLVFNQSHAAMPARPRYARTLRDSFMRPRAAWVRGTLGALPRENHGDRRDKAAQIFRARSQGEGVLEVRRAADDAALREKASRSGAKIPAISPIPWQEPEVPAPPGFARSHAHGRK